MNISKVITASLIGSVISFLAGWLVFGILLMDAMQKAYTPEARAINKAEPNLAGIFLAGLVSSFLIAYILERWVKARNMKDGIIAAAIIGFLFTLGLDISLWSMLNMWSNNSFIIVDVLANTLMYALIGGVIGWFLGFKRND